MLSHFCSKELRLLANVSKNKADDSKIVPDLKMQRVKCSNVIKIVL